MSAVKPERDTQNRVLQLFTQELGYTYLGDWQYRDHNNNIETTLLTEYLQNVGYTTAQISKAILQLQNTANQVHTSLYERNKAVYHLLRYGIKVKTDISENTQTIHLINWQEPQKNRNRSERVNSYGGNREGGVVPLRLALTASVINSKTSRF